MDKYKYQVIALGVALGLGFLLGGLLSSSYYQKRENALIEEHKLKIDTLIAISRSIIISNHIKMDSLTDVIKHRGDTILTLKEEIKMDGVRVEKRRREAAKMTRNEKVLWLKERYKAVP